MKYTHKLTPEQENVLRASRTYYNLYGTKPTLSALQIKLGYSNPSSVQRHVKNLKDKGLWSFEKREEKFRDIPLAGNVACGPALLAEENISTYVPYPEDNLKHTRSKYFFLRANGNSMNLAGIEDGDYMLVRQQHEFGKKDRVIVLIGDDATCKYLEYQDGLPVLVPCSTDPEFKKQILLEEFTILGVVESVVKPERRYGRIND